MKANQPEWEGLRANVFSFHDSSIFYSPPFTMPLTLSLFRYFFRVAFAIFFINASTLTLQADTFGDYTYTDDGTSITITGYPVNAVGAVDIPPSIIGKPVTSIGTNAFINCVGLTNVTFPDSVNSIGTQAFLGCSGLTTVTIGQSVTSIGTTAFLNCTSLTVISVSSLNSYYSSSNGILFNKSQTTLIQYPNGKTGGYTAPDSVTTIGPNAFQNSISLTNVTLGNSVTSIVGNNTFYGCTNLTSITLGNGLTNIGPNAFFGCTSLTSVAIPNSVTSIGIQAFSGCSGLTNITFGGNVASIGANTFLNCNSLTNITLGNSVTSIGNNAFQNCTSLTNVTLGNSVISIGNSAFLNCTSLTTIYLKGNAPTLGTTVFPANPKSNVYYLLGSTGWTSTFGGLGTVALGLPTITAQPSSIIANVGENAAFNVIAKTTPPLTLGYQWQRNGIPISGATASSLYLNNIQSANVGTYTVIISNDSGIVASTVTLTLTQGTLYTQTQYEVALQLGLTIGMQAGRTQVTDSPNSYGLYSLTQVEALNVGTPLLTKDQVSGKFKLTIGAKKSVNLSTYTALPFSSGETTINPQGELEFQFISPDNAAFFRLESH